MGLCGSRSLVTVEREPHSQPRNETSNARWPPPPPAHHSGVGPLGGAALHVVEEGALRGRMRVRAGQEGREERFAGGLTAEGEGSGQTARRTQAKPQAAMGACKAVRHTVACPWIRRSGLTSAASCQRERLRASALTRGNSPVDSTVEPNALPQIPTTLFTSSDSLTPSEVLCTVQCLPS